MDHPRAFRERRTLPSRIRARSQSSADANHLVKKGRPTPSRVARPPLAGIRLLDAEGTPLDQLDVSDGRTGETALVLGSFRRRANGDWEFVTGGRGYRGGLEELVQEYGIDVE
ncbi:hypothetical protein TK78_20260 [Streptomyces sp. Tue 6075]|nr:hypothetical protein TK78_20260 [Streptomyces sp. Tue 6075]